MIYEQMMDFDSREQSSDLDDENVEAIDSEMNVTTRTSGNSNNQCTCACHNNDKREMEDDSHCNACLNNILHNLGNAID